MLLNVPPNQMLDAILAYVVLLLLCLPIHEFGHAWVATYLGDTVAEREGRVTLNPLAHLDPFGAIALAAFGFGWAKPVPFNPGQSAQSTQHFGRHHPGVDRGHHDEPADGRVVCAAAALQLDTKRHSV